MNTRAAQYGHPGLHWKIWRLTFEPPDGWHIKGVWWQPVAATTHDTKCTASVSLLASIVASRETRVTAHTLPFQQRQCVWRARAEHEVACIVTVTTHATVEAVLVRHSRYESYLLCRTSTGSDLTLV